MQTKAIIERLIVGLQGPRPNPAEAEWLQAHRPAGVILFGRNVRDAAQLESLCAKLKRWLPAGAEIVADHEGGPVSVLAAALGRPPAPFGLGQLDDPDLTFRVHRQTGRRMRDCGLDRVLAPCADVLVAADNPIIGARAFGVDPQGVARHVAAAVAGLVEAGLGACLKHWPGHGGTGTDSHLGPAAIGEGRIAEPFAAGVRAGADAVMIGHLTGTGAGTAGAPATLDPAELIAARALGPPGALRLYTDDITMGALCDALAAHGVEVPAAAAQGMLDPGSLPLAWLTQLATAGCDRLLCRGIPWRAIPAPSQSAGSWAAPVMRPEASAPAPFPGTPGRPHPALAQSDPDCYAEARERLAGISRPEAIWPPRATVLWLDETRGDHWGDARRLEADLAARCGSLTRSTCGGVATVQGSFDALLVTSHRPLTSAELTALRREGLLAAQGCGLAMGHPSLGTALSAVLPAAWSSRSVFDIRRSELLALWGLPG